LDRIVREVESPSEEARCSESTMGTERRDPRGSVDPAAIHESGRVQTGNDVATGIDTNRGPRAGAGGGVALRVGTRLRTLVAERATFEGQQPASAGPVETPGRVTWSRSVRAGAAAAVVESDKAHWLAGQPIYGYCRQSCRTDSTECGRLHVSRAVTVAVRRRVCSRRQKSGGHPGCRTRERSRRNNRPGLTGP